MRQQFSSSGASAMPLFSAGRSSPPSGSSNLQDGIRGCFDHVADLFSSFTKHIAPTYHHDRPERSVQVELTYFTILPMEHLKP